MARVIYPNYNGVYTTVIDTVTPAAAVDQGADAILIVGVAEKGPMNRPITVDDTTAKEIFGSADNLTPSEFEKSVVRGYEEVRAAQNRDGNIRMMRVGNARRASMTQYENRKYMSGNLSYTDVLSKPSQSLVVEAFEDGDKQFACVIEGDTEGIPIRAKLAMTVQDTDGNDILVEEILQLDVTGTDPAKIFRPSQLAAYINLHPDYSQHVFAGVPMLEHTAEIDIIQDAVLPSGIIQKEYDIEPPVGPNTGSFGDKMDRLVNVVSEKTVTEIVSAGSSTFSAERVINKSADVSVRSIPLAYAVKSNEILVQNITALTEGGNTATLGCASDNSWEFGSANPILELVLTIVRGGVSTELTETTDYSINSVTGEITFVTTVGKPVAGGFQIGDTITATYKYRVSLAESKTRTDLIRGSDRSYFVIGKDIIFGTAIKTDIEVTYNAKITYEVGPDVIVSDADEVKIQFINAANLPEIGDVVSVTFDYEPELPAIFGYQYPSGHIQESGLSGGSSGTQLSLADYKDSVREAFDQSENYSARFIVVEGAYFDDTIDGYNYNTGLPEKQNIGWHDLLKGVTDLKSTYVSECEAILTAKPMTPSELQSSNGYRNWLTRMTVSSANNPLNTANVAKVIKDFRMSIVGGEILGSGVASKLEYPLYSPNILAAMKSELPNTETLTNKQLPGNVTRMRFLIKSAKDINALNGMRYTTLGIETSGLLNESNSPVKIMDAPTMSQAGSQFDRQSTYTAMIEGLKVIRRTLLPFIGRYLDQTLLVTINNRLNSELQGLVPNVLRAFLINVNATRDQILEGTTAVTFNAVTGSEVRRFTVDATASKVV